MSSVPIDDRFEQMTTANCGPRKKKFKDPEMARCFSKSETKPTMKLLGENAAGFIKLFESRHSMIQTSVHYSQFWLKKFEFMQRSIVGLIGLGIVNVLLTAASGQCHSEKYYVASVLSICPVPFLPFVLALVLWLDNSKLKNANLIIAEFRRTVFLLAVELGKLKQRCEDVKGSLSPGLERENLERLEESIVNLLYNMERLADTATPESMDNVQKDYVDVFNELEKMRVRLSFYRETSDEE